MNYVIKYITECKYELYYEIYYETYGEKSALYLEIILWLNYAMKIYICAYFTEHEWESDLI